MTVATDNIKTNYAGIRKLFGYVLLGAFLIYCCMQLFQNILTSTELQFPDGALEELNPDCVDLCRCLLRQDPGTCSSKRADLVFWVCIFI